MAGEAGGANNILPLNWGHKLKRSKKLINCFGSFPFMPPARYAPSITYSKILIKNITRSDGGCK